MTGVQTCALPISLIDAVGENVIRRAPVAADMILTSLEAGKPAYETLTANI